MIEQEISKIKYFISGAIFMGLLIHFINKLININVKQHITKETIITKIYIDSEPQQTTIPLKLLGYIESQNADLYMDKVKFSQYQIMYKTANNVLAKHNIDTNISKGFNYFDYTKFIANYLINENIRALKKNNLALSYANQYILWQQGIPNGIAVLTNNMKKININYLKNNTPYIIKDCKIIHREIFTNIPNWIFGWEKTIDTLQKCI